MERQSIEQFYISDRLLAQKAAKEAETIRYIRLKTDLGKPEAVWKLYRTLLERTTFETPVGLAFLTELYSILINSGKFRAEELPRIPVITTEEESRTTGGGYRLAGKASMTDRQQDQSAAADGTAGKKTEAGSPTGKTAKEKPFENATGEEVLPEQKMIEEVRNRTRSIQENSEHRLELIREGYKLKTRNYKVIIIMLVLIIAGLLAMVYFSDTSPFVDAKTQVIDQYSEWEEQLKAKEEQLQEWENRLNQQDN